MGGFYAVACHSEPGGAPEGQSTARNPRLKPPTFRDAAIGWGFLTVLNPSGVSAVRNDSGP